MPTGHLNNPRAWLRLRCIENGKDGALFLLLHVLLSAVPTMGGLYSDALQMPLYSPKNSAYLSVFSH